MPQKHEQASHRDHPLRKIQNRFEGQIPGIMYYLFEKGLLADTQLEQVIQNGQELLPDDLTLAGLEFTIKASKEQIESPLNMHLLTRFFLGGVMNASDGAHARHLHLDSPDGAVKDVLADRISENFMATIISRHRSRFPDSPDNLEHDLNAAFQLSTLSKAACEMSGVHTSEGGPGSMLERRQQLFFTLMNLGRLNHLKRIGKLSKKRETGLLRAVDARNRMLIDNSIDRAKKRVDAITSTYPNNPRPWNNPDLDNPYSSAAVEARKYAAVVEMNWLMTGIDMVGYLNSLSRVTIFPTAEELGITYPYITASFAATREFRGKSMEIADSNL